MCITDESGREVGRSGVDAVWSGGASSSLGVSRGGLAEARYGRGYIPEQSFDKIRAGRCGG